MLSGSMLSVMLSVQRIWPTAPLRKMCPGSRSLGPLAIFLLTLTAVTLLVVAASALLSSGGGPSADSRAAVESQRSTAEAPRPVADSESLPPTAPRPG